jgi:hypothetical protein
LILAFGSNREIDGGPHRPGREVLRRELRDDPKK